MFRLPLFSLPFPSIHRMMRPKRERERAEVEKPSEALQRVLQLKRKHRPELPRGFVSLNNYKVRLFILKACSSPPRKVKWSLLGCIHQHAVNSRFIWRTLLAVQYRIRLKYHNFRLPPRSLASSAFLRKFIFISSSNFMKTSKTENFSCRLFVPQNNFFTPLARRCSSRIFSCCLAGRSFFLSRKFLWARWDGATRGTLCLWCNICQVPLVDP